MTGGQFSGVDIDLLADYVGGALDGTPEETVVAGLVADDPAWREAHDALTGGMESVGAELRQLGAADEPMPADVVLRLNTVLAELPRLTGPADRGAAGSGDHPVPAESTGTRRHLVAVPDGVGAERERAPRRGGRRALRRWAAPVAVAAGVVVFAGVGISGLLPDSGSSDLAGSTATDQQATAPMLEHDEAATGLDALLTTSGLDYDRDTLKRSPAASSKGHRGQDRSDGAPTPTAADGFRVFALSVPSPELQRLLIREALLACIAAITAEHGAGAVTPESVDYAAFEGRPALVVRFAASDGVWSWVSGPLCGTPDAAADTRYQVRVR